MVQIWSQSTRKTLMSAQLQSECFRNTGNKGETRLAPFKCVFLEAVLSGSQGQLTETSTKQYIKYRQLGVLVG